MSSAVYVFLVCFIVIYVFAIFCTEYLGRGNSHVYPGFSFEEVDEQNAIADYNPHIFFGTMYRSMLTLFNFAMGEEWSDIMRPIAMKEPIFLPALLLFIVFVAFGIMNVLIAVIVDVVVTESRLLEKAYFQEMKKSKLKVLDKMVSLLKDVDQNGDGALDVDEMAQALNESGLLRELVESINLPLGWEPAEMIDMLDARGSGKVSYSEFATAFVRLLDSDDFQQICIMESSINAVKKMLTEQNQKVEAMQSRMQADIASIKAVVRPSANRHEQFGGEHEEREAYVGLQGQSTSRSFSPRSSNLGEQQSSAVHKGAAFAAVGQINLEQELSTSSDQSSSKDMMTYLDSHFMAMKASIDRSETMLAAANTILQVKLPAIESKLDFQFAKTSHTASSDNAGSLRSSAVLPTVGQQSTSSTDASQNLIPSNWGLLCSNKSGQVLNSQAELDLTQITDHGNHEPQVTKLGASACSASSTQRRMGNDGRGKETKRQPWVTL